MQRLLTIAAIMLFAASPALAVDIKELQAFLQERQDLEGDIPDGLEIPLEKDGKLSSVILFSTTAQSAVVMGVTSCSAPQCAPPEVEVSYGSYVYRYCDPRTGDVGQNALLDIYKWQNGRLRFQSCMQVPCSAISGNDKPPLCN